MKIDFHKKPEGATHINQYSGLWVKYIGGGGASYQVFIRGQWEMGMGCMNHGYLELAAPESWTGEGLPPVGIEIEAMMCRSMHDGYAWHRAKVVHGPLPGSEGEVLVFCLETTSPAWVDEFRPVRTPEQIAAEEKSEAIRDLIALWKIAPAREYNYHYELAEAAHDAGYRKRVEP